MIINKLMTLSQFVDWQYSEVDPNTLELLGHNVVNYNSYLKQPLTKAMFINEIEKPKCYNDWLKGDYPTPELMVKCREYQEAESKVIFKGEKIVHNEDTIEFKHSDNVSVYYYQKEKDYGIFVFGSGFLDEFKTLSNLAESTNGELQIHLEL